MRNGDYAWTHVHGRTGIEGTGRHRPQAQAHAHANGKAQLHARRGAASLAIVLALGFGAATPAPAQAQRAKPAGNGVVVSASSIASEVGARVLRDGGNAVDAAVATGFALAVTRPSAGNIGGGGFMVIRFPDGRTTAFDFREKAPLAAHAEMFVDSTGEYSSRIHHNSHVAVGVPGTVAGFWKAHGTYGAAEWQWLVEPAVRLARDGFAVPPGLARSLESVLPRFERYPASLAAYSKDGEPYAEGDTLRQPDLARTLERILRDRKSVV